MHRFKNILFVAGPAEPRVGPLARAVELARSHGARLTLVAVVDRLPPWSALLTRGLTTEDLQQAGVEQRRADLERLGKGLAPDVSLQVRVLVGSVFLEVIRLVLSEGHDLVFKSAEGAGSGSMLFGSTDLHLLRKCPVPVWIDKPTRAVRYRRVLAAVDPRPDDPLRDELDARILRLASTTAEASGAELHVLHAWTLHGEAALTGPFINLAPEDLAAMARAERRRRDGELRALLKRFPPGLPGHHVHLLKGPAARVIPAFARRRRVDVVVMGTVGRTGLPGLLIGNTAENVLSQVSCSVLAVKPEGFVSPVTAVAG